MTKISATRSIKIQIYCQKVYIEHINHINHILSFHILYLMMANSSDRKKFARDFLICWGMHALRCEISRELLRHFVEQQFRF